MSKKKIKDSAGERQGEKEDLIRVHQSSADEKKVGSICLNRRRSSVFGHRSFFGNLKYIKRNQFFA